MGGFLAGLKPAKNQAVQHSAFAPASALVAALLACVEATEKGSILEKLVLFMPKNAKKTH